MTEKEVKRGSSLAAIFIKGLLDGLDSEEMLKYLTEFGFKNKDLDIDNFKKN